MLVISSCATTPQSPRFIANVDSINSGVYCKTSYILLPGNNGTNPDDIQFKEFAAYVNRALVNQRFIPVSSLQEADIAIFLSYGIGDPKEHQYTYSIPTWGQTGVSSSHTYGTINTYGNFGTYSGTTTYTPTYGITGRTTHTGSYTSYFRYIVLDAFDLEQYKKSGKEVQLWKTTVTSSGSSGDLRRVFPLLVAASQDFIGKNTGQKLELSLYETDERVLEIKGFATKTNSNNGLPDGPDMSKYSVFTVEAQTPDQAESESHDIQKPDTDDLPECPVRSKYTASTIEVKTSEQAEEKTIDSEKTTADRLKELQKLKDSGLITDHEYQKKRAEIIDGI